MASGWTESRMWNPTQGAKPAPKRACPPAPYGIFTEKIDPNFGTIQFDCTILDDSDIKAAKDLAEYKAKPAQNKAEKDAAKAALEAMRGYAAYSVRLKRYIDMRLQEGTGSNPFGNIIAVDAYVQGGAMNRLPRELRFGEDVKLLNDPEGKVYRLTETGLVATNRKARFPGMIPEGGAVVHLQDRPRTSTSDYADESSHADRPNGTTNDPRFPTNTEGNQGPVTMPDSAPCRGFRCNPDLPNAPGGSLPEAVNILPNSAAPVQIGSGSASTGIIPNLANVWPFDSLTLLYFAAGLIVMLLVTRR